MSPNSVEYDKSETTTTKSCLRPLYLFAVKKNDRKCYAYVALAWQQASTVLYNKVPCIISPRIECDFGNKVKSIP